jgi:hypothetical protein
MSNNCRVAFKRTNEYIGIVEKVKHDELLLLIAIRSNSKIPIEEFYKLFDDKWHLFSSRFRVLETEELFIKSALEHLPGSYKYELTKKGNHRIMELVNERSYAIDLNLVRLKNASELRKVNGLGIFRKISGFFTQISARNTNNHSDNAELTVPGKNNVMRTY